MHTSPGNVHVRTRCVWTYYACSNMDVLKSTFPKGPVYYVATFITQNIIVSILVMCNKEHVQVLIGIELFKTRVTFKVRTCFCSRFEAILVPFR